MRPIPRLRRLAAFFGALGVATAASVVVAPSAGATYTQAVMTIGPGNPVVEKDYPPLGANEPSGAFTNPKCADKPGHFCDVIPMTFIGPAGGGNDFVVSVELSWKATPVPQGIEQSNDLDMYLFEDPVDPKNTGAVAKSGSSNIPERAGIAQPKLRKYQIVVYNFAGVSEGFHVKLTYYPGGAYRPDESLDPTPRSKTTVPAPTDTGPPPRDLSGADDSGSPVVPAVGSTTPDFGPAPLPVNPDFVNGSGTTGADEGLTDILKPATSFGRGRVRIPPPKAVSGASVFLAMLAAPLLVGGLGGYWLLRRRPAALVA